MDERPEGNYDLPVTDVFNTLNPYFLLFFALSCIISSLFLQEVFAMLNQFRIGIAIAPFLGIVVPIFLLIHRFPPGFRRQLSILSVSPHLALHTTLATLAMVVVVDYLYVITQRFLPAPTYYLEALEELKPVGLGPIAVTFIGICLVVPIAEEIVFRGVIQRVFGRHMTGVLAAVLAGVFFGVIHFNPQLLASMTAFGIFVGLIFFTSNITYTIIAHSVLNTVAFIQLTWATDDELQTAPFYVQDWWSLVLALVLVVVLLRQIKKGASTSAKPL